MVARPRTLKNAVIAGSRVEELQAMKRMLATAMEKAQRAGEWRDLSPLAGRLMQVSRELEELQQSEAAAEAVEVPDEPFDASSV